MAVDRAGEGFDILDLWSTPGPAMGAVAFSAGPEGVPVQPPAWRLDLPVCRGQAADRLAAAQANLDILEEALAQAGPRLRRLASSEAAGAGVTFDATAAPALPAAEQELLEALPAMALRLTGGVTTPRSAAGWLQAQGDAGSASFGVLDQVLPPAWKEASAEVEQLFQQAQRLVTHYAWIETAVAGRLIGQTTVTWTGDLRTLWPAGADAEEQRLHERSVRLALATRAATVRIVAVVATGAVTIVPLLATPGSAVLALPAIWKFIRRIRSELERASQLNQEK